MHDATSASGLDFHHFNGMSGEHYFNEVVGAGAAFFDFDNDGDLDLYLVQGAMLGPGKELTDALFPPAKEGPPRDRLYRNDLKGSGPRFVDVTETSGLTAFGYGMGVATGDFDNDGWLDLYVTNYGANQLWRNLGLDEHGGVSFEDVTRSSGAGDDRWSTSVAVLDFDRDGWLDLYVTNYVDFRFENHRYCRSPSSRRDYCGPQNYNGESDLLLRNLGPGEAGAILFEDVTLAAGIGREAGSGLGVVSGDFDGDGWLDLYVANDLMHNVLWRNLGDGSFENVALVSGVAVNAAGKAEASMGLAAGDLDQDGDEDLFMSHLRGETNTAFENTGGDFHDASSAMGLAVASRSFTGFGVGVFDLENDGDLDLAVANGDIMVIEQQLLAGEPFPLRQPNQLFRNLGDGEFSEVGAELAGSALAALETSRGLAVGDVDNDGDEDLLLTNNNGPARLLVNEAADGSAWVGLRLITEGRDALGARVTAHFTDGSRLMRRVRTDGSYCSARDPRVLFGLPAGKELRSIEVQWPDGLESWPPLAPGQYHRLIRGQSSASGSGDLAAAAVGG